MAGNCYRAASKLAQKIGREDSEENLWLCHGQVTGKGKVAGQRFGHAWVEIEMEIDGAQIPIALDVSNGGKVVMPRCVYYILGQIDPAEVRRYTPVEICNRVLASRHWGPWD